MRRIWIAGLLAGCGFSSPPVASEAAGGSDGRGDLPAPCDITDPELRLCMSFDSEPMLQDLSGLANVVADASQIVRIDRDGYRAAQLTAASKLRIAETTDLDLTTLTVEMWIAPGQVSHPSYRLLDNHLQYFMALADRQWLECGIGPEYIASAALITDTEWHHVACTFDGKELRAYVDGSVSACAAPSIQPPTTGVNGTAIGSSFFAGRFQEPFVGGIDDVHVYARALSASEICSAADRASCAASCPPSGSGGGGGGGGGGDDDD